MDKKPSDNVPPDDEEFRKDQLQDYTWYKGAHIKKNPEKKDDSEQKPQPIDDNSNEEDEKSYESDDSGDDSPAVPYVESSDDSEDEEEVVVNPQPESFIVKKYPVPQGCSQKLAAKQPTQKATVVTEEVVRKKIHTTCFLPLYLKTPKNQTLDAIVDDLCKVVQEPIRLRIRKIAHAHKDNIVNAVTMLWTNEK
jgi:hypothetical protein